MKKLLIATCLFCLAGLFAACDKDDDSNPFAATWKCRIVEQQPNARYFTYWVYELKKNNSFREWTEDESGCVIGWIDYGTYSFDRNRLVLRDKDGYERTCEYWGNPPGKFAISYDEGKTYEFYRQL